MALMVEEQLLSQPQAKSGPSPDWRQALNERAASTHRAQMCRAIAVIVEEHRPSSTPQTTPLCKDTARSRILQLEEALWEEAPSLQDYLNRSSLRQRLRRVKATASQRHRHHHHQSPPGSLVSSLSSLSSPLPSLSSLTDKDEMIQLERRKMIVHIFRFLEQRHKQQQEKYEQQRRLECLQPGPLTGVAPKDKDQQVRRTTLLSMSRHCEVSLYRQAQCLAEYQNVQTLPNRLRQVLWATCVQREKQEQQQQRKVGAAPPLSPVSTLLCPTTTTTTTTTAL